MLRPRKRGDVALNIRRYMQATRFAITKRRHNKPGILVLTIYSVIIAHYIVICETVLIMSTLNLCLCVH
jgi:hypothetical protein